MKIVHCFFTMHIGGSQVLAADMLNEMCKEHDVALIVVNDQWNDKLLKQLDPKVKVYLINRKEGSRNPLPVLRFNLLLRKLKPDVIHCHEDKLVNLIRLCSFNTVYTVHDLGLKNSAIAKYNKVIAISAVVQQDIRDRFNIDAKIIHNGIPLDNFKKRSDYVVAKGEPVRLVQVSRLMHKKKGQDILISALHKLVTQYHRDNVVLDMVGGGSSLDYLKSLAEELGITQHINFIGEKDRGWIFDNLAVYHALIQPSIFEGFGLTVVEGIAAGLPVAASNIEGPAEILSGGANRFLFTAGDADDCAEKINALINIYTDGKMRDVINIYSDVKKRFSLHATVKEYISAYKNLN